ncbi:MAG: FKBP-type peptidyl-prolyl cis-trans isomerase [Halobacteriovoraceae bacterium]|jgi:FKBP-type peptidyl-prolyl cis-trans isomerase FkpA|nr:FKBP-type peptidyl-prolyl cis-trans isomerase [Halobacteriovoraceae bacterium]
MMKMILVLLLSSFMFIACNEKAGTSAVKLKTEDDKTFYAMGFMLGSNLQRLNLNDHELSALYTGIVASAKNKKSEVEMQIYQPKIQQMFKSRMENVSKKEKSAGDKYLADYMKKNPKAKKTASGLVYEVLKEGTGKLPTATDKVEVHYHGTLTNGDVFDSSVDRGKTISFPLNRVIKGWTEGLQLVKEGGKIKLVIPSELGYGDAGAPPKIPGGATLVFEVELFKVNPEPKAAPKAAPAKKAPAKKK